MTDRINVLIAGGGGREHALAWKIAQSPLVDAVYVAPGNGGTARFARNLPIAADDVQKLAEVAQGLEIGLVVAGTEAALAAGLVDACQAAGIPAFGPVQAAAQLESSKAFAKDVMAAAGIPTAGAATFDDADAAREALRARDRWPVVIKADGLAAGKGVVIAPDLDAALEAVDAAMDDRVFGDAGARILMEDFLEGREITYTVLTDGERFLAFPAYCDYKRVNDGDEGPNTGSMGGYSPPGFMTPALDQAIRNRIVQPLLDEMRRRGTPFTGCLYCGLMIDPAGEPWVVEFNARFGDPEAEVLLPLIDGDLVPVLLDVAQGHLEPDSLRFRPDTSVGVVLASQGYPGPYRTGRPVTGLETVAPGVIAFHAGTRMAESLSFPPLLETSGGRVFCLVATAPRLVDARDAVYRELPKVQFGGRHFRTDIAWREFEALGQVPTVLVTPPAPPRPEPDYTDLPLPTSSGRKRKRKRRKKSGSTEGAAPPAQEATS